MKISTCNVFPVCAFGAHSGYIERKSHILGPSNRKQIMSGEWNLKTRQMYLFEGILKNQHTFKNHYTF